MCQSVILNLTALRRLYTVRSKITDQLVSIFVVMMLMNHNNLIYICIYDVLFFKIFKDIRPTVAAIHKSGLTLMDH